MADSAFQTIYRTESIAGFEVEQSMLRTTVTTEHNVKGNTAVFLVADSGSATASTRGLNGKIPARPDNLNQYSCTLNEWHDLTNRTSFNVESSQGDGRAIMQRTSRGVINRKIDLDILAEMANTSTTTGTAQQASLALVTKALTKLGNNAVPVENEDDMFFVASPGFRAYLLQIPEFASADYVDVKPLVGPARKMQRWAGFNWIFTPLIAGVATSSELCYAYHRDAMGHAINMEEIQFLAGYEQEQDYSWARTSAFMGSKLLQTKGVVKVTHDGSAFA